MTPMVFCTPMSGTHMMFSAAARSEEDSVKTEARSHNARWIAVLRIFKRGAAAWRS